MKTTAAAVPSGSDGDETPLCPTDGGPAVLTAVAASRSRRSGWSGDDDDDDASISSSDSETTPRTPTYLVSTVAPSPSSRRTATERSTHPRSDQPASPDGGRRTSPRAPPSPQPGLRTGLVPAGHDGDDSRSCPALHLGARPRHVRALKSVPGYSYP